ncbi:hypothetical protein FOA52_013116 [Chlamydomonas sp. UWO 241]|nr:hypothetical protein FOA52_013116 [Chlamydomonas sp. UWO 241]
MSTEDETRAERAPPVAAKGRKWSNYAGVSWSSQNTPAWRTHVWDPQTELLQQVGSYASEEDAARAYDRAAVKIHGPGAELNFLGETPGEQQQQQMSSRYIGVRWIKSSAKWCAELRDRSAKRTRRQYLGSFVSEADAARAYDHATVRAHGPGVQRNFPGEPLPAVCEEPRQQRGSSRYLGVSWDKCGSAWRVCVYDGQTRRPQNVGRYASEEDAARAYDFAAVQQRGKGTERNFPGEDISELPVAVERRKQPRGSSCFLGVSWDKFHSAWHASMWDQQTKCSQHIGRYASKEDAARAYDFAVVQARGPGTERNFPGEEIRLE